MSMPIMITLWLWFFGDITCVTLGVSVFWPWYDGNDDDGNANCDDDDNDDGDDDNYDVDDDDNYDGDDGDDGDDG